MSSEKILGIDFGTTNSVCAVLTGNDPEVLENAEGERKTPSVAYYTKDKEQNRPLVGVPAENKAEENPDRVIRSVKREMGDSDTIDVAGEEYVVERVAADIIRKIRTDAAEKLNIDRDELTKAVITTPAYWEGDRKQAVVQAGEMAGFESIRTIKEPAAAAIAYGRFEPGLKKTVGVYDLGGGTFDFALVDVDVGANNTGSEYNVMAQSGDPELGGDDWDDRIVDWLAKNFIREHDVNPLEPHETDSSPVECQIRKERMREKAREAKEALSNESRSRVNIRVPFLMNIEGEPRDIDLELSQVKFESLTEDLVERTVEPVHTALDDAGLTVSDVDDVILVGGSTRMPQVRQQVKSVFNKEPKHRVNPDEAVAAGAAIKANREDILLLEVTPLSLGIAIKGGKFKRMIERNERLPARATEVFTTASDGATAVRIPVYQGERDIAEENRHLKTLVIEGMAPGNRNSAHIEVTFEVQQNGLINVQAVESTRNKSVDVELEGENRLPDEYIAEQVEEARQNEKQDKKRQKVIDAQNNAKAAISKAEDLINEFEQVFEADEMEHMKKHIANVKQTRKDNTATLGDLREATEELDEWVLEVGDRVRKSGARSRSGPSKGPDVSPATVESDDTRETGVRTSNPGETVSNTSTVSTGESSDANTSEAENWDDVAEGVESAPEEPAVGSEEVEVSESDFDVGGVESESNSTTSVEVGEGDEEESSSVEVPSESDGDESSVVEDEEEMWSDDGGGVNASSGESQQRDGVAKGIETDSEFEMSSDGTWADEVVDEQESEDGQEKMDEWSGEETSDDVGSDSVSDDVGSESVSDDVGSESVSDDVGSESVSDDVGSESEYVPGENNVEDGGESVTDFPLQDTEPVEDSKSDEGNANDDSEEEREEEQTGFDDIGFE